MDVKRFDLVLALFALKKKGLSGVFCLNLWLRLVTILYINWVWVFKFCEKITNMATENDKRLIGQ